MKIGTKNNAVKSRRIQRIGLLVLVGIVLTIWMKGSSNPEERVQVQGIKLISTPPILKKISTPRYQRHIRDLLSEGNLFNYNVLQAKFFRLSQSTQLPKHPLKDIQALLSQTHQPINLIGEIDTHINAFASELSLLYPTRTSKKQYSTHSHSVSRLLTTTKDEGNKGGPEGHIEDFSKNVGNVFGSVIGGVLGILGNIGKYKNNTNSSITSGIGTTIMNSTIVTGLGDIGIVKGILSSFNISKPFLTGAFNTIMGSIKQLANGTLQGIKTGGNFTLNSNVVKTGTNGITSFLGSVIAGLGSKGKENESKSQEFFETPESHRAATEFALNLSPWFLRSTAHQAIYGHQDEIYQQSHAQRLPHLELLHLNSLMIEHPLQAANFISNLYTCLNVVKTAKEPISVNYNLREDVLAHYLIDLKHQAVNDNDRELTEFLQTFESICSEYFDLIHKTN